MRLALPLALALALGGSHIALGRAVDALTTPVSITVPRSSAIPVGAAADTHVMPLRGLATTERATAIKSPAGNAFALDPGGKTLFTGTTPLTTTGDIKVTVAVQDWQTGAVRDVSFSVRVGAALSPMVWWYAPTAQGNGSGSSAANAASLSSLVPNIQAANAAGRPADHRLRADLGTYARGSATITIPVGGTSELTRQHIRGVDASGNRMKAVMTGNRVAAPTTNQTLAYMFLLTNDASFITFSDFNLTNVSCFCNARGRDSSLGVRSFHRELEFKRFAVNNAYRLILLMPDPASSTWPAFITATEGLRVWDVDVDYLGHSLCKGFNIHRLDTRRCSANGRGVSQTNNFPAMYDFSGSFGASKYDICTRLMFSDISCTDLVDYQFTYSQGDMIQLDSSKIAWDGTREGIAGDTFYVESDGTTIADYIMVLNCTARGMSDGALDVKVSNLYVDGLTAINVKRGLRDWNTNQAGPSYVRNLRVYNTRWPAVRGTDDHPCHYLGSRSDLGSDLFDPVFVLHDDLTVVPDGSGRTMLGSDADSVAIILGDSGRSNQKINLWGWRRANVKRTAEIWDRGGTTSITGFTGVTSPAMPAPTPGAAWKAGKQGGIVPTGSGAGTELASLTGFAGTAVEGGILHYEIASDPDNKFEIVGNALSGYTLRLKNAVSYAAKASHTVVVRATPGILGPEAYRDPADFRTWQCWLGPVYVDMPLTIALSGAEEAETTTFFTTHALTDPTGYWRPAINARIRALKDAGVWATADFIPCGLAWNESVSLLDLKCAFDATKVGSPLFDPKTGWTGAGVAGSYLRWNSFDPAQTSGRNFLRDTGSIVIYVGNDVIDAGNMFTMGGNTTFRPRKNGTQGEARLNNNSVFNVILGAAGAAGAAIGSWALHRRSSASAVVRQNGLQRGTSSAASNAINGAGLPTFLLNCITNGTLDYVGYLVDDAAEQAERTASALYRTLVGQFP
ncbi:MAG: hypothetical protein DI537_13980 [Stutzerimonas stutzeri]|nr:MAG: hypothetical protein DI537_13980 [Stutzerimonas stutzeri]